MKDKTSSTLIKGPKEGKGVKRVILREGDLKKLYKILEGPSFSEKEKERRSLKYKVFISDGIEYKPQEVTVRAPVEEVIGKLKREGEGNLISLLNEKEKIISSLVEKFPQIKVFEENAKEYINKLKKIDEDYRSKLKEAGKSEGAVLAARGEREQRILKKKEMRRKAIEDYIERKINNNKNLSEKGKTQYKFLTEYFSFLFHPDLILGSGDVADIKVPAEWVSEHQGLIYKSKEEYGEWEDTISYENLGLCNHIIMRFYEEKNGNLETSINLPWERELIDFRDKRKQRSLLFLTQKEQELSKYEEFETPEIYVAFELPHAIL